MCNTGVVIWVECRYSIVSRSNQIRPRISGNEEMAQHTRMGLSSLVRCAVFKKFSAPSVWTSRLTKVAPALSNYASVSRVSFSTTSKNRARGMVKSKFNFTCLNFVKSVHLPWCFCYHLRRPASGDPRDCKRRRSRNHARHVNDESRSPKTRFRSLESHEQLTHDCRLAPHLRWRSDESEGFLDLPVSFLWFS